MSIVENSFVFDTHVQQPKDMSQNALETVPIPEAQPHGNIPNTPLASSFIAFSLGIVFTLGSLLFALGGYPGSVWLTDRLGAYLAFWALFHWLEFAVTAGWNREKLSVDSYLLDNGKLYHVAHIVAVIEYIATSIWKPKFKTYPYVSEIGIAVVLISQVLRSVAMIHAATNFSHAVAYAKREGHTLVSDGVYSWFRHPSYTGFYYWALGTQLLMQNPVSFVGFAVVLWKFFSSRIKVEEAALIRFFGDDYKRYKARVGTKIPFIR